MKRRHSPAPDRVRNDVDAALATMGADALRELVREMLLELDDRAHSRIVNSLINRAARGGSGWAPAALGDDDVAEVLAFAKAAERRGQADPTEVDEHLRRGSAAFLRKDYTAAHRIFVALLGPVGEGEIGLPRVRPLARSGALGGLHQDRVPALPRAACGARPPSGPLMSTRRTTPRADAHQWEFKARFRRHAFGWKSQPAIQRVRQAVSEIKRVARRDPMLAAEGAVLFLERVSPAIEQVDSSSGAIGTAVNHAVEDLAAIIAEAPADATTRDAWLERLWEAHANDQIPYIERLADYWGEMCASKEVASAWADRLLGITRTALSPDKNLRGHFHGSSACLSALFRAERYADILDVLQAESFWPYKRWAVKALGAIGKKVEAIALAESSRGPWTSDADVDALCEEMLLSSDLVEEAYARYGLRANRGGTYLATFRAVAKRYPHKPAERILADLVKSTPGDEGKWFAAAKELGLYDTASQLAHTSPCDPKTLARAARDHAAEQPAFAVEAGVAALDWLVQGFGYEITGADVWTAYSATMKAAEALGRASETKERIRRLVSSSCSFVAQILGRELGLER